MNAARLLLTALLLFSSSAYAQVHSVKIYIVPWDVSTRIALSADDVRRHAWVKTEILDEHLAKSFVDWLVSEELQNSSSPPVRDIRLVIDIESKDGSIESYYANFFELVEEKSGRVRKINEAFRSRFGSFL